MKRRQHVRKNHELRKELIEKGFIVPFHSVPEWLKKRGFPLAAEAAAEKRRGAVRRAV